MSELKVKLQRGSTYCHDKDYTYVTVGLGLSLIYTYRLSDYHLVTPRIVSNLLFLNERGGEKRAKAVLDQLSEEGIVTSCGGGYYSIEEGMLPPEEDLDDRSFIWITLAEFNKIKEWGGSQAPDLFHVYLTILTSRLSKYEWKACDLSMKRLAEKACMAERTLTRYLDKLKEAELIYVAGRSFNAAKGQGQTNIYGAYADKDAIIKYAGTSGDHDKRNFKISVVKRYNSLLEKNGAGWTMDQLDQLERDIEKYNETIANTGTIREKDPSVIKKFKDRIRKKAGGNGNIKLLYADGVDHEEADELFA